MENRFPRSMYTLEHRYVSVSNIPDAPAPIRNAPLTPNTVRHLNGSYAPVSRISKLLSPMQYERYVAYTLQDRETPRCMFVLLCSHTP